MKNDIQQFLEHIAYNLRVSSVLATTQAGSGHVTSALSAADLVAALFFYAMRFDPNNPHNLNNDHFVLSKGHAAPILYAVWKELGILSQQELMTLRQFNSVLEGHPTPRFSRVEAATGSLGQGLSIGAGICLSGRINKRDFNTYVLMGDSELTEGQIWEAITIAGYYKLNHLIGIIDANRLGQSAETIDDHHIEQLVAKCAAFGWHAYAINGHDMKEIMQVLDEVKKEHHKPSMIIAKTFKGYGVDMAQDKLGFHGRAFKPEELEQVLQQLQKNFSTAIKKPDYHWQPTIPSFKTTKEENTKPVTLPNPEYKKNEMIATRKAYGQALTIAGTSLKNIISLDAEVKNSTYAELFEQQFPDRFIQCFIAEQNMVSMAVGLASQNNIPFVSTFGVFFTRAFDQLRMAAISRAPLRLCGSHAGVSIGQDGPSQMGLEDIAMIAPLPNSVIVYPCDAVSTHKCVEIMANYTQGISYLRTTRLATAVLYDNNATFTLGSCKILRQSDYDQACIIAAGITVHEALKAYEILKQKNIFVAVIDAYSIKPLDTKTIIDVAKKAQKRIITVEDHYLQGGLGQIVCYALRNEVINITCLAVTQLPRSGTSEELMSFEGINAQDIVDQV